MGHEPTLSQRPPPTPLQEALPDEVWACVLSYLDQDALEAATLVCQDWCSSATPRYVGLKGSDRSLG